MERKIDPLQAQPTEELTDQQAQSPLNPPGAFSPNVDKTFTYEEMHAYLQGLIDEHRDFTEQLQQFTEVLEVIEGEHGVSDASFTRLQVFMTYFDEEFIPHNRREERQLFPILRKRMLEQGEHSTGDDPITPVTVLEREHIEAMQTGAVAFSFLALARHLKEEASMRMVLSMALELGNNLVKVLELHIFREDKIVFNMAQDWLTPEEFAALARL